MNKTFDNITTFALAAVLLFIAPMLSTVVGALVGWIVGLVFGPIILDVLSRFGVETTGLGLWAVGATLGFASGFLPRPIQGDGK